MQILSRILKCCIYLQVLVPSQRYGSGVLLGHLLPKDGAVVADDGLDSCLVVHVYDKFLTTRGDHHIRPSLYPASNLKKSCIQRRCIHTKREIGLHLFLIDFGG
jgi:hypothetical protein